MGNLDGYFEMKRLYKNLVISNRDVIQRMKDRIDKYSASRNLVNSVKAGRSIHPECFDFNQLCGSKKAAAVFGILIGEYLTEAGWVMEDDDNGRGKKLSSALTLLLSTCHRNCQFPGPFLEPCPGTEPRRLQPITGSVHGRLSSC